jgi:tRNA(His) 5'-end guanylyltransferase
MGFIDDMGHVAISLCEQISGAVFAYHQSDEISVLVQDWQGVNTQRWFGGQLQKIVSLSASIATSALIACRGDGPLFDARVFVLPSTVEVANYFLWRQQDAIRNSITMAAQARFSHKQLHGVNTDQDRRCCGRYTASTGATTRRCASTARWRSAGPVNGKSRS